VLDAPMIELVFKCAATSDANKIRNQIHSLNLEYPKHESHGRASRWDPMHQRGVPINIAAMDRNLWLETIGALRAIAADPKAETADRIKAFEMIAEAQS
jgi:hypothetical protein